MKFDANFLDRGIQIPTRPQGERLFPPYGTVPTRPRCHYCRGVIVVDLHADDELWCAVMRERFGPGYICVNCFASRADEKMIDWAPHVRLIPLSLVGQMRVQAEAAEHHDVIKPCADVIRERGNEC